MTKLPRKSRALAAACLMALSIAPGAASAADAAKGAIIAERWCAHCHGVTAAPRRGDRDAPDFAAIGRDPAMDGRGLATFLAKPHGRMPDLSLTRGEIDDLVAYIRAQAR